MYILFRCMYCINVYICECVRVCVVCLCVCVCCIHARLCVCVLRSVNWGTHCVPSLLRASTRCRNGRGGKSQERDQSRELKRCWLHSFFFNFLNLIWFLKEAGAKGKDYWREKLLIVSNGCLSGLHHSLTRMPYHVPPQGKKKKRKEKKKREKCHFLSALFVPLWVMHRPPRNPGRCGEQGERRPETGVCFVPSVLESFSPPPPPPLPPSLSLFISDVPLQLHWDMWVIFSFFRF